MGQGGVSPPKRYIKKNKRSKGVQRETQTNKCNMLNTCKYINKIKFWGRGGVSPHKVYRKNSGMAGCRVWGLIGFDCMIWQEHILW